MLKSKLPKSAGVKPSQKIRSKIKNIAKPV